MPKLCQPCLLPILLIINTIPWPPIAHAANILVLFAHPSEGHFAVMRSLVLELAKREHNVTVYSSHRLDERVENLREVIVEPEFPFWAALQEKTGTQSGGLLQLSQLSPSTLQKSLASVGAAAVDYFLSQRSLQQLLQLPSTQFDYDLLIVDLFYSEALLALGQLHAKPTIAIISTDFEGYMQHVLEQHMPIACSPNDYETYTTEAGYWQRLSNIRSCITRRKEFSKYNRDAQEQLIRKHFAHISGTTMLQMPTLYANLALLLLNNHVPLTKPRPLLPNAIAAGGLHIRPPRDIPWHIRRYLDESRAGVIYMHLGNEQLCGSMSKTTLQTLFNVLGKHKERVLWTCHDVQQLEGLPKNILIQHGVPQTDILAHPHVRVFIMNGDLLGLQEGIVRHVPMIGIPIFRNEVQNMQLAVQLGVAVRLDFANLTEASLTWALQTLMYSADYPVTIRQVAAEFRDRPLGALDTCVYWIDYVLRHEGGATIKTLGVGMPSSQLHLFDLFVFYFLMALLFVAVLAGIGYSALLLWRRHQVEKIYAKMN